MQAITPLFIYLYIKETHASNYPSIAFLLQFLRVNKVLFSTQNMRVRVFLVLTIVIIIHFARTK